MIYVSLRMKSALKRGSHRRLRLVTGVGWRDGFGGALVVRSIENPEPVE
jgi:hypothetical protein